MVKNLVLLFISLVFVFIGHRVFSNNIKVSGLEKRVVIYPKKIKNSTIKLSYYDKKRLELIEEIRSPTIKYIFITKMPGEAYIIIDYNKNSSKIRSVSYKVDITIKRNGNNFSSDIKVNGKDNTIERIIKGNSTESPSLGNKYSFIDKEIMKNANTYYSYIVKLFKRRLYNQVLVEISNFINLFPNDKRVVSISKLKGKTYIKLLQYDKAIDWYKELIEKKGLLDKSAILILLGNSYEKIKSFSKAKLSYLRVLTLSKEPSLLADAHFCLGRLYFSFGENKMGILELEELINKYPEAREKRERALYMLGEMYYKNSPLRDYKKSYYYFRLLKEEFMRGIYSGKVTKKIEYLKNNFIKYY